MVTIPRRKFITLLGSASVAWPRVVGAQQKKLSRIGALVLGNADAELFRAELEEGLRSSGYIEGQNVLLEFRSAEGKPERLPELAAELVALKVDVIVAVYTPCAFAAQRATRQIPIVILAGNPVETGLVSSLARPGGNITRHIFGGSRIAWQMRRTVPRHAAVRPPSGCSRKSC
jgi:putative ABC transport system substrate-binding protein